MPEAVRNKAELPIFFLGVQMATGGAQRVLLLQADWFSRQGYPVTVAFLYDKENLLPAWCTQFQFPIHDLGFARPTDNLLLQAACFVRGIVRLFRLLRGSRYTAIETFTLHANLIGLPLAWLAGIPNRIASHRGKIESVSRILERINAMVVNSWLARCLVVVSDRVREDAVSEGVRPERIVKIANGVVLPDPNGAAVQRVREELDCNPHGLLMLNVGRLRRQKGQSVLLDALPAVVLQFPDAQMLIAGDGVLRDELEAQAAALHVSQNVRFLGRRQDVAALMSLADLFVFPSRFEGMPNAVLEAMSHGLPVIATAVQGVDEIIRDGENGILVPLEDPAALAAAILRMLSQPAERQRLGTAARQTIEGAYTVERMCRQYEQLLIRNGHSTAPSHAHGLSGSQAGLHYSYTLYADAGMAEKFDQSRFGGQVGQLVALAQEHVLADFLGDLHGATALDVGSGTGRAAFALARLGARVTALDRSQEMLRVAKAHAEASGLEVEFVPGDANSLMFPDQSFDVVISLRMLMHTPDWRHCLGEMCRVARQRVVFDYPPLVSAPALQVLYRRLAQMAGRQVETYHVISTLAARSELRENGFQVVRLHRQFVLPIALHKLIGSRRFTELSESLLSAIGLPRLLGSPVTMMAERCPDAGRR